MNITSMQYVWYSNTWKIAKGLPEYSLISSPIFDRCENELILKFKIISFCFANKKLYELSFTEFDVPVEITPTVYPVCLPESSLDPEHLAGKFVHKLTQNSFIQWSVVTVSGIGT